MKTTDRIHTVWVNPKYIILNEKQHSKCCEILIILYSAKGKLIGATNRWLLWASDGERSLTTRIYKFWSFGTILYLDHAGGYVPECTKIMNCTYMNDSSVSLTHNKMERL